MEEPPLRDVDALDRLCKYYGMPRPRRLGASAEGSLDILQQDPSNIVVIRAGGTFHTPYGTYEREHQILEPTRFVKATNWLKSIIH